VRTGKAKLVVQKGSVRFTCPRRNRADTAAEQRPPTRNFDGLAAIIQRGKRGKMEREEWAICNRCVASNREGIEERGRKSRRRCLGRNQWPKEDGDDMD
jgi:hypothetical protein